MTVKIKEEFIKLDSLLKLSGVAETGGTAKMIIKNGLVSVNNEVCLMRGKKIRPTDKVSVNGEIITVSYEG